MDPIIAGGLVSAGKNLLDGISNQLASKKSIEAQGRVSFPEELGKASREDASVRFSDSKSARLALMENPQVSSFMEKNANSQVYLEKRADGSIQLLSSSGKPRFDKRFGSMQASYQLLRPLPGRKEQPHRVSWPNAVLFDA